jgi:cellulose synthase/poly-beta-1,6-N-acetylglucosamine synthase-like glycosyltransferase
MQQLWKVGLLAVSAVVGHVLYPVALHLATRGKAGPQRPSPQEWPDVSVVVPAYLEAGVIGKKIGSLQRDTYPGRLEVVVVADGDPDTAEAARLAGARVVLLPERGGKAQALNAGITAASNEWIVLTDANSDLVEGSLERLVSWLADDSVGAVAGEKLEGEGGELAYWRFESWLKRREDQLGGTIGLDGGLCAIRRSVWRPIPQGISTDDLWIALDTLERGLRVAYEPTALVREDSIGGLKLSWERRTRVLGASYWVYAKKTHLLDPRAGIVSAQIWGHRLWRSSFGPLSHALLVAHAARHARSSISARIFLFSHGLAIAAVAGQEAGLRLPLPVRIAAQVVFLQSVALGGLLRFVRGDRAIKWKKPSR